MTLDAEKLVFSANQLLEQGQAGEAASVLQDCLLRFPDSGKACALLGYIYNRFFKEPFAAEEYFKKAMILTPDYTNLYIYYADALLSQERYTEMTAILNKSLETTGAEKNKIYFYFGLMNERQSKFEDAVDYYQRAIIHSLEDDEISMYQKSVVRCSTKQKLFTT